MVESLDVVEHIRPRLVERPVDFAPDTFGLERRGEAVHGGIVPNVADPALRASDAIFGEQFVEVLVGVLAALIRVDLLPVSSAAESWKIPVLQPGPETERAMKKSKFTEAQIAR